MEGRKKDKSMHTYKNVECTYRKEDSTLLINHIKEDFVPSYVYYVCEWIEKKENVDIDKVIFLGSNNKVYDKLALKRQFDWKDVDKKERNK